MKHKNKETSPQPVPKNPGKTKKKGGAAKVTLAETLNKFLSGHMNIILWLSMGLTLLFSILLFDFKVSASGDDSFYIIRASDFVNKFLYPSFQGPLYPMFLGIFILIFGLNLTLLKSLSVICMLGTVFFIHQAFKNRVPALLHLTVLLILSVNSHILMYASQTYNEAFYMLIQALVILIFFKHFIDNTGQLPIKKDISRHLLLAVTLLALTLTRSIGYSAVIAVFGYFFLTGNWKNLAMSVVAFGLIYIAYTGLRYLLWGEASLQFSAQSTGLMQKDFYNPARGQEDLAGFLNRFIVNSNLYISRHFFTITGFRESAVIQVIKPPLTIVFYTLYLAGLIYSYFRNRWIFFAGLMTLLFLLTTFLILQIVWDQSRLIIPSVPIMILVPISLIYFISELPRLRLANLLIILFALFVIGQSVSASIAKGKELSENRGKYDGLTPDWKHYIMASEWAAKNLGKEELVACRKPSISFIYGNGREFYGIMSVKNSDAKGFFEKWKRDSLKLMAFDRAILAKTQLPSSIVQIIRSSVTGQIIVDTTAYLIYEFPDSVRPNIIDTFKSVNLTGISAPDSLASIAFSGKKPPILVIPDSLLLPLIENKVTHVMTANLREHPHVKDGKIINTVERYMTTISDKYPDMMTEVHKIGNDDDEPATIFKLNYEKQKEKLLKKSTVK